MELVNLPISVCASRYYLCTLTSPIDELDARLIAELRENPRLGLLEISRRLGVARGTVQARLAKLEARGVITGFGPEIDPHELGHRLEAFVLLELTQGRLAEAVAALEAVPEVLETDAVSGPQDLICRVAARDTEHLQEIVNRLLATDAIRHTTSYVVLQPADPPAGAAARRRRRLRRAGVAARPAARRS